MVVRAGIERRLWVSRPIANRPVAKVIRLLGSGVVADVETVKFPAPAPVICPKAERSNVPKPGVNLSINEKARRPEDTSHSLGGVQVSVPANKLKLPAGVPKLGLQACGSRELLFAADVKSRVRLFQTTLNDVNVVVAAS